LLHLSGNHQLVSCSKKGWIFDPPFFLFYSYGLEPNHASRIDPQGEKEMTVMIAFQSTRLSNQAKGYSLMELLIAIAALAIISAIAIPIYTDYIDTARLDVMSNNIETIRLFEEDYRLSEGTYVAGTYDPEDPDAAGGLKAVLGWEPRTSEDSITYVVTLAGSGFSVVATDATGETLTKTYP
jgi:prepilin-type N-terminal cleavage/methylation domain-containing protein